MKKIITIAISAFIFSSLPAQVKPKAKTQSAKPMPTKQETIQWIVEKIKNNLKGNYRYIGFDEVNNILTLQRKWSYESSTTGETRDNYYDEHLYLNRINYLSSLMEAEGPKCLYTTYPTRQSIPGFYENSFRLQGCIDEKGEDDLYARIEKAFTTLIKYNKDEKKNGNEAF